MELIGELKELRATLKSDGYKDWCHSQLTIDKCIKVVKKITNNTHTILTVNILIEKGFEDIGKCKFKPFENMSYWVKNGICLFYNTPISKDYQEKFYVGYVDMRQGEYFVVAFRWIDSLEDLTNIYESITQKSIYT